jgi:glycosidase
MPRLLRCTPFLLALSCLAPLTHAQDFKKQVIYQIITDRFVDGDPTNNDPPQSAGLYDATKTNWHLYWGGDFAGIQQKIPYLQGMGVTAIWISPPVDNINVNIPDGQGNPSSSYHGYSARDFKRTEEHFGSPGNSWAAFDNMVSAAHAAGIKVIIDFAANHSNPENAGENGALYDNGNLLAAYNKDASGFFHHNPDVGDYNDRYQVQYNSIFQLADLNQENSSVDAYLKSALQVFQQHGVDGFRLDAVKHANWGWEYSEVNSIFSNAPSFVFGEWMQGGTGDALYHDSYKFANRSGMSLLDYPLYTAIKDVFGIGNSFKEIEGALNSEHSNFTWDNDLVTFIDNHDQPRLLSIYNNQNRLNEATAFLLTCRGIPIVYYGDEQYLHNDTGGGNDPYNRPWMSSFDTTTTGYKLVASLAGLRQSNPALAYGTMRQRWINDDVYIFERQFFNDVVLVAINKSETTPYNVTGLFTSLPAGTYQDFLSGLMGGFAVTVTDGGGNNPVSNFSLPTHTAAVWQATSVVSAPQVGSIGPVLGQPGINVVVAGKGFGSSAGSVLFGSAAPASVTAWTDTSVAFTVPNVANGIYQVQLKNATGGTANTIQFTVLSGALVPVTFTVNNAAPTQPGDYIFLTGSTVELGNWGTTFDSAVGPLLTPNYPGWFLTVSVPAGKQIEYKFIKIAADNSVTWEAGPNHTYTAPASGTAAVTVDWQYTQGSAAPKPN